VSDIEKAAGIETKAPHDFAGRLGLCSANIGQEERSFVAANIHPESLAYGEVVDNFEIRLAELMAKKHCVALNSGTSALHLALIAIGVQPGDLVLIPALTFVAPANATRYIGATPVLFDVDASTRQLDVSLLAHWLERECRLIEGRAVHISTAKTIAAVVPVDLFGHPFDIEALAEVVRPLGIPIVDDAAQALGATRGAAPVGSGAEVVVTSFNANKIITTGGGGALLSDDDDLIAHVRHLANQAIVPGSAYVHDALGFNYRLPTIPAALGSAQLNRLDEFVSLKRRNAELYNVGLCDVDGLTCPGEASGATSTYWLYTIHVDHDTFGASPSRLSEELQLQGIASRLLFTPLHHLPLYRGAEAQACPVAEELAQTGLSLPSSTQLTVSDIDRVCAVIREFAQG
jgi:dTDP-4-amino-4,6-dideoxygalactose transaminase